MIKRIDYKTFESHYSSDEKRLWAILNARVKENRKCLNPMCNGNIDQHYKRLVSRKAFICRRCIGHFHPLTHSELGGTKIKLKDLFEIIYRKLASSSGMSTLCIQNQFGMAYSSAHYLIKRIHKLMDDCNHTKFHNTSVEIDETYISTGNKGLSRNYAFGRGRENMKNSSVIAIVERAGRCVLKKVEDTTSDSLIPVILDHVDKNCIIYTDDWKAYKSLTSLGYTHVTVNHNSNDRYKRYKDGSASTNSAENLFSNLKRFLYGTHRSVSDDMLQLYLNEVAFKHSYRNEIDFGFSAFLETLGPLRQYYEHLNKPYDF